MQRPSNNPVILPKGVLVDKESIAKLSGYNKWWVSKRGDVITQKQKGSGRNRTRTTYRLHRVIMNAPPGMDVDHINGNRLDNRLSNLRVCTHAENGRNLKLKSNNTSGIPGVSFDKKRKKWLSSIRLNYKSIYLGRFEDFDEAVHARKLAEKMYFGEFAR